MFKLPSVRTMKRFKAWYKNTFFGINEIVGDFYVPNTRLVTLLTKVWNRVREHQVYGNLCCDAVALTAQVHKNEDGSLTNTVYVKDKDGEMKEEPIRFAFAYYFVLFD